MRIYSSIIRLLPLPLFFSALAGISNSVFGQAAGDYRSAATSNWHTLATWEYYNGTAWVAASSTPTSANGVITIRSPHAVTVTSGVIVDQVIIDAGGQIAVNSGITITIAAGTGTDMTVSGTLVNSGTVTTTGTLTFESGATYQHARNAGTIPTATWNSASNCNITGVTNTVPAGFNQTFGNLIWNCSGQTANLYLASNITIAGNFTVSGTGAYDPNTRSLRMSNGGTGYTITVNGNVLIDNNASFKMNNSTGSCTMNVGGNFTLNSGSFTIVTGGASSTLSVTGNVSISGGNLIMHEDASATTGTLNVGGNFSISGGTITETSTGTGAIIFNRTGTQTYSKTGGTISNNINFTVNSNSTLDVGTSLIDGSSGTFTLSSGAGIITANVQGLSTTAGTGSIRVTGTKTYSSGANYTYNGTSAQVTGNGLTGANNLTINNSAGVTLTSSTSIAGTLSLTAGSLSIGANSLTLSNGAILSYGSGSLTGGTTSNLTVGTGTGFTLNAISGGLNNLSSSRDITLGADLSLNGTLTLTSGTFTVGAYTLTLNGPAVAGTPSNLATTSSSSLLFGGTSAGVSIPSSVANMNNLTINNPSGVTLTGSFTVAGTLTMTQGNIISGTSTLTLSGATLSYTSGTITGKFQRAVASTGTQYLFPVGTASSYNPLKITFSNLTSGQLAVQFLPNDIGVNGLPLNDAGTEIFDRQVTGYWTMTAVAPMASTIYDVNLNYSGFTGVDALARIMKRTDGGALALDGTHGTVASPEITRTGMSGISTTTTDLAIGKPHPRFTTQPSDFTGCNATFSVTASGKAPLSYQWQENDGGGFVDITDGGIYSGATTGTLTITGAFMSMNGYLYRCIVTDALGYNATSNSATLTVTVVTLGYNYTSDITLDPASGSANLTDFPVLISLTTSPDCDRLRTIANGGHVSSSNGYDIIFTDQNGSALDHQIESYDAATGQYIAWVRIPVLSYTSSTTIIMHYGNPAVSSDPSVESVWASNYKGVWHLNGSDYTDATSNGNDGTQNVTASVAGRIAGGKDFNGTTSYIQVPTNGFVENDNNQTISIWANYTVTPGGNRNLISFQNTGATSAIQLGFRGGNAVAWKWGGTILVNGGAAPSINTWHYYVYTFDGTTSRLYIDGIEADNSTVAPQTAMPAEGNIGRYNNGEYIDAILDEPRFSMSPKSAGWILTEYNNQNDPDSFIILGTENSDTLLGSVGVCSTTYTLDQGYPSGGTYSGTGVTGTNFNASIAGVGTHSIIYSYTDAYGCTNNVSKDIIVTAVPSAPTTSNMECCYLNITDLEASGTNLRWYTDPGLTILAGTGTPFATGQTTAGIYTYYVTQTLNDCQSISTTVSLTIFNGITINTQPQPDTICPDGIANFTVSASGYYLTYQWQEDGANITDGGIYSGATTSVLTLTSPGITKNGKLYRCVVSTSCGTSPVNSNTAQLTIITDYTWTGTVNSDWNNTGNWICGIIPTQTNSVQIPDVTNKPVLSMGAIGAVNNLTIDAGSSLTVDGNTLQIAGTITNNGTFTATSGTIEMNGTSAQSIGSNVFAGNTIKDLTVNNAAGVTLQDTLNVTGIVTVTSGNLASGGYLIMISSASQTALVDGSGSGNITGNVTMQRYLPSGFGYKYFSSPFQAATVNEFGDDMDLEASFPLFYRYDESRTTAGWVRYDSVTRPLNPMHGYAVNFGSNSAADTVDVTGVVNNGSLSRTIYNNNNTYTKGFNLVGNPYPSPVNWNAASGWTKTNIDNALYYFKASATDQYGGTYSTYINGVSSDGLATNIIPSMQGVFVHVSDGTYPVTGTLAMNNSVRVTDLTHSFIKSDGSNPVPLLRLSACFSDDPASKDPVVIYLDEKALDAFDGNLDALKLMNTDLKVPNLYAVSSDGKKLSINALPFSSDTLRKVPLGLKTYKNGTVIFRIRDIAGIFSEMGISFSDKVTGTDLDLLPDNEYSIYLDAGEYQNRFFLNLSNASTGISVTTTENDLFRIYSSHGILKAEINSLPGEDGILKLYNLTGQIIFMKNIHAPGYYEFNPVINEGIYIASYISGTKRSSKKIYIQNR